MEEGVCVAMGVRSSTRDGVGEAENRVLRNNGSIGAKGGEGGRGDKRVAVRVGVMSEPPGSSRVLPERFGMR